MTRSLLATNMEAAWKERSDREVMFLVHAVTAPALFTTPAMQEAVAAGEHALEEAARWAQ